MEGKFDIDCQWDGTPEGWQRAWREQRGLTFTPARRTVRYVVVDKAD